MFVYSLRLSKRTEKFVKSQPVKIQVKLLLWTSKRKSGKTHTVNISRLKEQKTIRIYVTMSLTRGIFKTFCGGGSKSILVRHCGSVSQPRQDKLFDRIEVEVKAHQPDVLKSYSWFATSAAKALDVQVLESWSEPQPHMVRKTLLRSAFVKSKHRVQYEMR